MTSDTIAAVATPQGSGGIGIIRISGQDALTLLSGIFGRGKSGPSDCSALESHRVIHGYVFDPGTLEIIDEVLVIPMLAPRSYTAENVVEIHAHSGPMVIRTLLELVLRQGARLADPGEFTRRAFLNGRIDLTQAEAVMDIINARSSNAVKIAASQSSGTLSATITEARQDLIDLLALLEAAIDFPDEAHDLVPADQALAAVRKVLALCRECLQLYADTHLLRDGIRLAICGAPNVGKSSLMNRLLAKERAIVTPMPGTTRDLIQESLNIRGVPYIVSDTAGMRQTDDLVEQIGIEKAKKNIRESDLILYLTEPESRVTQREFKSLIPPGKKVILVINKIDLAKDENKETPVPEFASGIPCICISALKNQGITELRKLITDVSVGDLDKRACIVPNLRHTKALEKTVQYLEAAESSLLTSPAEEETLAIDIRTAADLLGEITGHTAGIDILDTIFSNFCIGK